MNDLLKVEHLEKRGGDFFQEVRKEMKDDDHHFTPEYVILKKGKIVGALGVKSVLFWWMKPEETNARDSLTVLNIMDNVMDLHGINEYIVPCEEKSPYYGLMPRLFELYNKSIDLFVRRT